MDSYKDVFLSESAEYLQSVTEGLLRLEEDPEDLGPVESVFRGAHSLKGMSGTMGYDATAEMTHKMESLMETVRRGDQPADRSLVDLMLRAVDAVKSLIEAEAEGLPAPDTEEIGAALVRRAERKPRKRRKATVPVAEAPDTRARPQGQILRVDVMLEPGCVLKSVRAYLVLKELALLGTVLETRPSAEEIEDEHFDRSFQVLLRTSATEEAVRDTVLAVSEVAGATVAEASKADSAARAAASEDTGRPVPRIAETQTVRISIAHVDMMVNLVGELLILRSRLERIGDENKLRELLDALEELRRVSSELQHEVMQTRMVPVANIFNRFPRMVRDLARDLGKQVTFLMDGLDIELDRTVLDEIGDAIVHLLRNAVDHGIETAEERRKSGKPEKGVVRLAAGRERDQVQITVSDDGRGMDLERIWANACSRGLVDASEREHYSTGDVLMLTCTPGFSTVETATRFSGRGVGMDVVRDKIEYLGGSLYIKTAVGEGSEFILTIPLTLAIVQALLLRTGDQVFALPLSSVAEVMTPDELPIQSVDGMPVVILRNGSMAPLYHLDVMLGLSADAGRMPATTDRIVLVELGRRVRALAVEGIVGGREIVVKPLGGMLNHIGNLGGATVLGDGKIVLILDPRSLFTMGE